MLLLFLFLLPVTVSAQMHIFATVPSTGNLGGSRTGLDTLCQSRYVNQGYSFCQAGTIWAMMGFSGELFQGDGYRPPNIPFNASLAVYGPTEVLVATSWTRMFDTSAGSTALANKVSTAGLTVPYWFNFDSTARTYYTVTSETCQTWTSTAGLQLGYQRVQDNTNALSANTQDSCSGPAALFCACLPPGTFSPTPSPTTASPTLRTRSPTTVSCNRAARRLTAKKTRATLHNHHHGR